MDVNTNVREFVTGTTIETAGILRLIDSQHIRAPLSAK